MEENRRDKFDFVPQDVPELLEKHRWKRGTDSARLIQASLHCLSGLVFVLVAKDFAESSWLSWEPELKFAFVALMVVAGIGWLISAASLGLVSYVNLNIFSQGFVLAGSCAAAAYLAGALGSARSGRFSSSAARLRLLRAALWLVAAAPSRCRTA